MMSVPERRSGSRIARSGTAVRRPSRCERKVTPSSVILRSSASDMTWKPPESVRIGPFQPMNACSPPSSRTRSAPGRRFRWYVLASRIAARPARSCRGQRLDRGLRADGHEDGSADDAVTRGQRAGAGAARRVDGFESKVGWLHPRSIHGAEDSARGRDAVSCGPMSLPAFRRRPAAPDLAARPVRHRRPRPRGAPLRRLPRRRRARRWWQVLPLGPTGYGDSPYQSLLGLRRQPAADQPRGAGRGRPARRRRTSRTRPRSPTAASTSARSSPGSGRCCAARCARFARRRRAAPRCAPTFAAFRARAGRLARRLRALHGAQGRARRRAVDRRGTGARCAARAGGARARRARRHAAEIDRARASASSLFFRQWTRAARARPRARRPLIGDCRSSSPTTAPTCGRTRELFQLDATGRPTVGRRRAAGLLQRRPASCGATRSTAGTRMRRDGYAWWIARLRAALRPGRPRAARPLPRLRPATGRCPAGAPTAEHGRWVPGPGASASSRRSCARARRRCRSSPRTWA